MGYGDKGSPSQLCERILHDHKLTISESFVRKVRDDYFGSIGKKPPTLRNYPSNGHTLSSPVTSPASVLEQFILSIQACGGVSQARKLIDLLETGIK